MVSIIIPARNEKFLQKTINGILENATSDIEIIAGLDGYNPEPALESNSRLKILRTENSIGMRQIINEMVKASQGDFIMKTDAHCIFDKGFDEKLSKDCEENWVVIPRQYVLDDDNWCRNMDRPYVDYWYLSAPDGVEPNGCPIGLHGVRWRERQNDLLIDNQMSFQGSCWFMSKKHFYNIDLMDSHSFGDFANEGCEIGMKTWLSGGRVVVNKKTWFAHLHKGKKHGRGYFLSKSSVIGSGKYTRNFCMGNSWPKAVISMKSFVDIFSPVPTWIDFDWSKSWLV